MTLNNNPTVSGSVEQHAGMGLSVHDVSAGTYAWRRRDDRRRAGAAGRRPRCLRVLAENPLPRVRQLPDRQCAGQRYSGGDCRTTTPGGVLAITNFNPYWRLAYAHDWGANSMMVGTYGMVANVYPDNLNTTTPTDRYRDVAVDAQYQYITDVHTVTAQATYIWEKQSYNASYPITQATGAGYGAGRRRPIRPIRCARSSSRARITTSASMAGRWRYFQTTGSADEGLYGDHASGDANTPNSNGYILGTRLPPDPERSPGAAIHRIHKFDGATLELRRQRTQCQRQQHAVLRRLGRILTVDTGVNR